MVNLEVWSPAGFSMEKWIAQDLVNDGGPLGPSGRSVTQSKIIYT